MLKGFGRRLLAFGFSAALWAGWPAATWGEMAVFDQVTTIGTPVTLAIRTTRLFLADGGRLVDIYLEDERLGRIMTGADGYGYTRIVPQAAGLRKIRARMGEVEESGWLLVMEPSDQAVLVELEAAFMKIFRRDGGLEESRSALTSIGSQYPLIYTYRLMGSRFSRNRLEAAAWPASVTLPWHGSETFEILRAKGVRVHAVIGSAEVVEAARPHADKCFSFERTRGSQSVAEWGDIVKDLMAPAEVDKRLSR
jgi:hypothetical protein